MRHKAKLLNLTVFIITILLTAVLSSCSDDQVSFPSGTFTCSTVQGMYGATLTWNFEQTDSTAIFTRITRKGTYIQTNQYKPVQINGTWEQTGHTVVFQDDFCREDDRGEYIWSFDGEALTFELISDECEDRKGAMTQPWIYVDDGQNNGEESGD